MGERKADNPKMHSQRLEARLTMVQEVKEDKGLKDEKIHKKKKHVEKNKHHLENVSIVINVEKKSFYNFKRKFP